VPGGWDAFTGPGLLADLTAVHCVLRQIYDEITRKCLIGTSGTWQRPTIDAGGIKNLRLPVAPASRAALRHYLSSLRPDLLIDPSQYTDPDNRARTTHVYPLADLAYSVCFSEHHGQLFGHIRVNVFSDLGGAGVSVVNDTVVKIRKGVGVYDEQELTARAGLSARLSERATPRP
jgi:hypothetical protein